MNVIFDVKKDICKNSQSAVWLEVFFVGCMDIEVLAIGLVIKFIRVSFCVPVDEFYWGVRGKSGWGSGAGLMKNISQFITYFWRICGLYREFVNEI